MGTIDNVYVLNYLMNKYVEGKGGIVRLIDLRAAFDKEVLKGDEGEEYKERADKQDRRGAERNNK